jgi:hypothetical protein
MTIIGVIGLCVVALALIWATLMYFHDVLFGEDSGSLGDFARRWFRDDIYFAIVGVLLLLGVWIGRATGLW